VFDLTSKVALVTGSGQGVGTGIATALAGQGARVAVNDVVGERAEQAARRLCESGAVAEAFPFDVTDGHAVASGTAEVVRRMGPIDILVNNAGVPPGMRPVPFRSMPIGEWDRFVDLNLYGSLNVISAVVGPMCDRRWGRIVQISSSAATTGVALGVSLYGAAKSGIEGFIRHLSQEVAPTGVTANIVALGLMDNAWRGGSALLARPVPVGRLGSPADVGAAVVYVASEEASWLTGHTLQLNGGQTTR
jgi:NAD(P)-dependent dehydrogenase (short-subunit alcohol dehydrogenase family)